MSRRPAEVEREVEETRAHVDRTVEAIRERMSVDQLVEGTGRYLRDSGGGEIVARLGEQIRAHPVPLAMVGIGLAWLMSGRGAPRLPSRGSDEFGEWYRDEFGNKSPDPLRSAGTHPTPEGAPQPGLASRIGEGLSSAASAARDAARHASDAAASAAGAAGSYAHVASGAARHGYGAAAGMSRDALRTGSDYGTRARDNLAEALEREPLVFAALGLAVGAGIGALLPSTKTEDRYLGPVRDSLRDEAVEAGREQLDKARAVAGSSYEAAREAAEREGLLPAGNKPLAEKLRDVAGSAAEAAEDEARKQDIGSV